MTKRAARLLAGVYQIPNDRVRVIPHGAPEVEIESGETNKARLGSRDERLICTFGLINRGQGLEYMIQAMPRIVASCPEAPATYTRPPIPAKTRSPAALCHTRWRL